MEAKMVRSLVGVASGSLLVVALGACGGGNKQSFQASIDSMTKPHDSAVKALDSGQARQVDTTKLGAAKTESILSKARKSP
jgi:hypothetical protein